MASYTSIGTYDATVLFPSFRGLMQYGDGINTDPRYARDAMNVETPGGVLQPCAANKLLTPVLDAPIETLAILYRRWHTVATEKELFVAACAGKLYAALPGADAWTELTMPEGISSYQSNVWSWVTYEINPVGGNAPVDVMLLSNALDGMVMVRGDDLSVSTIDTKKKFGVIARYAERIWGGAIIDDPDMLAYSAPYDPTDWEAKIEIPEDGAGDIQQPSWDGDSFTALEPFGSQLIAFKRTRVWRILGTDPGEYTFKEQYGGGAPYAATIAADAERIFMLTQSGVAMYDGLSVTPFQQEYIRLLMQRANTDALDQASACFWRGRYYCALPLDESLTNNAVLIFDTVDGSWLVREDVQVEDFLPAETGLFYTSATTPGRVWEWSENSWEHGEATKSGTRWISGWVDLGYKDIVKGGFEVYLLVEVQDRPVQVNVAIQTEKKLKRKSYLVEPSAPGKHPKQKRLRFGGTGRRFRLIIETPPDTPPWRIVSGITVKVGIDPD